MEDEPLHNSELFELIYVSEQYDEDIEISKTKTRKDDSEIQLSKLSEALEYVDRIR